MGSSLRSFFGVLGLSVLCAALPATAQDATGLQSPEASTDLTEQKGGTANRFIVAAANPIAVKAGYDALKAGGSAIDAALITQLVLNLVEPQSSGIGGGAFILYWDNTAKTLYAYDGRETAPATATEARFLTPDGTPLRGMDAIVGGKSVGVPGLLRLMELTHGRHGRLPWPDLFTPAIRVAEDGFRISPRLFGLLQGDRALNQMEPAASHYYLPDGTPKPVGTLLKNPDMAATLETLARDGADAFYTGPIAEDIVAAVTGSTRNPADMTLADLAGYEAKARDPLCAPYHAHRICGMPAPTSGGIGVLQTMGLLEHFNLADMAPWSAEAVHLFVEASKLVYADRAVYIADPDIVPVPQTGLVDHGYLADRAALIDPTKSFGQATAGDPPKKGAWRFGPGESRELPSTTHMSVIDADGNAVAMTSSIENAFGSRLMVRGFLLNNELTDFSYDAVADGKTVANRVGGNKRPRSSMSPTIVFDGDGAVHAVSGSPGGMAIVPLVSKTLIAMLDWGMTPQEATNLGNVLMFGQTVFLEDGTPLADLKDDLEARGHRIRLGRFPSGVHALQVRDGVIYGGADPRREGTVMGE